MQNLVALFTRHATLANIVLVVMLGAGLWAAPQMRAQYFPDSINEELEVSVTWDGAGADDVESDEDGHWIYCAVEALNEVSDALEKSLGESTESKLIWKPQTLTEVDLDTAQKLMRLIDLLEEDDDVQTVTHNFDIPEDVAAQL